MREIKFRAWDTKIMSYDGFSIEAGGRVYWFGNFMEEMGDLGDSCTLMQHTGLKDENGKEIYEGDIFKDEHEDLYVITWIVDIASFGFYLISDEEMVTYTVPTDIQVISNIYEDPELLSSP